MAERQSPSSGVRWLCAAVFVLGPSAMGLARTAAARTGHPSDECWVEARYVPEYARLEVAVRVDGLALDTALSHFVGRDVKLDGHNGAVAALAYVTEGLVLEQRRARAGEVPWERCPLRWIGFEFEGTDAWMYVEVDVPAEPADLRVSVDLLFDLSTTQRNDLEVSAAGLVRRHVFQWESAPADVSYLLRPR